MDLSVIALLSIGTVLAILLTLSRMVGFRKVVKHSVAVDFMFSGLLIVIFVGTVSGMVIAVMSGLVMAIVLTIAKFIMYPKPRRTFTKVPNSPDWYNNFNTARYQYIRSLQIRGASNQDIMDLLNVDETQLDIYERNADKDDRKFQ